MRNIKRDYRDLRAVVKDTGLQVVFSLVLLIKGKGIERVECGKSTDVTGLVLQTGVQLLKPWHLL